MARERGGKTDENETGFAGICFLPMDLDDRAAVACQGWRAIVGQREDDVDARGRRIGWQREAHRFTGADDVPCRHAIARHPGPSSALMVR